MRDGCETKCLGSLHLRVRRELEQEANVRGTDVQEEDGVEEELAQISSVDGA